ncbi:MAG: hypothetical protein IPN76_33490 [Saprospiraceae bacterium]|nr:hypothetical protein [Saprospiraceae bacterium]
MLTSNTYKKMDYGIYAQNTNLFTSYDEFGNLNNVGIRLVGNGHQLYRWAGQDPRHPNLPPTCPRASSPLA